LNNVLFPAAKKKKQKTWDCSLFVYLSEN
jgi:hypothetical protein